MTRVVVTHAHPWKIRLTVAATAVLGMLSFPTAVLVGEPYPWLMMPAFRSNGGLSADRIERDTAAFTFRFADGSATTVDPKALFSETPSQSHYVLTSQFSTDARAGTRFERKLATIFPNLQHASRSRPLDDGDPELQQWLGRRAHRLFPGRSARSVTVRWQRVSIAADGTRRLIDSRTSLQVQL